MINLQINIFEQGPKNTEKEKKKVNIFQLLKTNRCEVEKP